MMRCGVLEAISLSDLAPTASNGGTEFGTESIAKVQNSVKKLEIERADSLDEIFRKPLLANDLVNRQVGRLLTRGLTFGTEGWGFESLRVYFLSSCYRTSWANGGHKITARDSGKFCTRFCTTFIAIIALPQYFL